MGNLTNILSELKFFNSKRHNFITPLNLEAAKKQQIEGSLFYDINQAELSNIEQINSRRFLVYGRLNPIINNTILNEQSNIPNDETFDFNVGDNWVLALLRPSDKPKTEITYENGNTIDLTNGLPLVRVSAKEINGIPRIGFNSVLGHDFIVGNTIRITDTTEKIGSGDYEILMVDGNTFYISLKDFEIKLELDITPDLGAITQVQPLNPVVATPTYGTYTNHQNITWINESEDSIKNHTISNIRHTIFGKRLDNTQPRDYYIKTLRIISTFNDFDPMGFAKTPYGGDTYQYSFDTPHDLIELDSRGNPINEIIVGLFKTAKTPNLPIGPVYSNFSSLIWSTNTSSKLSVVSELIDLNEKYVSKTLSKKKIEDINQHDYAKQLNIPGVGDQMLFGLVSYDNDSLEENIIQKMEHTFTINPSGDEIRYAYDPFKVLKIRERSPYIEVTNNNIEAPTHAQFDTVREQYRWRDTYDMGFFDIDGNGVEFPFMNGQHYVFGDFIFNLKNQLTPKYDKDYQAKFLDDFFGSELLNNQLSDLFGDDESLTGNNDFIKYEGDGC